MAARVRAVAWSAAAAAALDDVISYVAQDSHETAVALLERALESAASLATFAERGRVVPEVGDTSIREIFVFKYRLMYRVREADVIVVAFVHGARDFAAWAESQMNGT